jgi:hypothetical protein
LETQVEAMKNELAYLKKEHQGAKKIKISKLKNQLAALEGKKKEEEEEEEVYEPTFIEFENEGGLGSP